MAAVRDISAGKKASTPLTDEGVTWIGAFLWKLLCCTGDSTTVENDRGPDTRSLRLATWLVACR